MLAEGHRDRQCKYENLNRLENVNMSLRFRASILKGSPSSCRPEEAGCTLDFNSSS